MKIVGNIMNILGKKGKTVVPVLDSHGFFDETLTSDIATAPSAPNAPSASAENTSQVISKSDIADISEKSKDSKHI